MAIKRNPAVSDEIQPESAGVIQGTTDVVTRTVDGKVEVVVSTAYKINMMNYEDTSVFGSAKGIFHEDSDMEANGDFLFDMIYAALRNEIHAKMELLDLRIKDNADRKKGIQPIVTYLNP